MRLERTDQDRGHCEHCGSRARWRLDEEHLCSDCLLDLLDLYPALDLHDVRTRS